ncbi:MAG: phosphoglycerate dehydrogenase [Gemmatimonadota bacterium]|nr:MAG: phosphoglycerate dehydrogenase [Gemmatimonadota bacterium]
MSGKPSNVYRVLLADEITARGLEILAAAEGLEVDDRSGISADELLKIIGGYEALIVRSRTKVTNEVIEAGERLKVLGRAGVGVDNIDIEAATRRGIVVLNAPGGNVISAAEHTLALMLALVRHVARADASLRRGEWERGRFRGIELHGKTLGLVGAGRIGAEVAKRAQAFGMKVMAFDPYLPRERAEQAGISLVDLQGLLETADVISIHTPLTDETKGLIGADQLSLMKPTAYLVNAARGGVIDEIALADALRGGRLAGAALDVFEQEPVPADHLLLQFENVLAVPHLGAATQEAQTSVGIEICESVRDALLENDFRAAVNVPELASRRYADLAPLIDLTHRLGRVLCGLSRGSHRAFEVRYAGTHESALRAVAAAGVRGLLCEVVAGPLTMVNALHVAADRGLAVRSSWLGATAAASEIVELRLRTAEGTLVVAGVLLAGDHARITRIDEYRVDIQPRGTLIVLRNRDVPGVVGKVGSVLGEAGVNIAEYHQARREAGGAALAAIAVDGGVGHAVIERLAALPEVDGVWEIQLPEE